MRPLLFYGKSATGIQRTWNANFDPEEIFKNSAELTKHVAKEHSNHFGKCVEEFYPSADMLSEKKIQLALEKMKHHELVGQDTFVVFFIPELKVISNFT